MIDLSLGAGCVPHSARRRNSCSGLIFVLCVLLTFSAAAADSDGDNVDDSIDNCSAVANADQRDSDQDGYGNRCDTDLNNDNVTNSLDIGLFRGVFLSTDPHGDFNGDGIVNSIDIGIMRQFFLQAPGPGAISSGVISQAQAARFLSRSTYGTTQDDIDELQALNDYDAWLNQQFNAPISYLLQPSRSIYQANYDHCIQDPPEYGCPAPLADIFDTGSDYFRYIWWENAVEAPDQLRQRVAFALSQILVVSDKSADVTNSAFGLADYYDVLLTHALGNYRDLLEDVTLHPIMGSYLSMVRNDKPDPINNVRPDENYARELMQLLTIGVHRLNLDGTEARDNNGDLITNYDQSTIENLARALTGWNFANLDWYEYPGNADKTQPMVAVEDRHDTDPKTLIDGIEVPGGQNAAQDLDAALDSVFNHPNIGPFLSKQLIKRLVTSNPSSAYVRRVAQVFNNNGSGVRGDLGAVVKAILLDGEALDGVNSNPDFGKLREPMLRMTDLFRTFAATPIAGGDWDIPPTVSVYNSPANYSIRVIDNVAGQNILGAPSVFNFYRPDFSPPGVTMDRGLVAPEFQIANENSVIGMSNLVNFHVQNAQPDGNWTYLDFSAELSLLNQPADLVDRLDLLLTSGAMSPGLRQSLLDHLNDESFPENANGDLARVRDAVSLVINSPEYLIQK